MSIYDIAVIGKGLIGAGAIRHLTISHPDLNVCIIGPDEPENRKTHTGVFASHYDEGRITRIIDPSPIWGHLARASIQQYPHIESTSGIQFHHKVGCLRTTDICERAKNIDAIAEAFKPPYTRLTAMGCREAYPYLEFSDEFIAWAEHGDAGYINPRALVKAQITIAEANGADIIREIVQSISQADDIVTITTRDGNTITAKKILIAAGGYSNSLLDKKLDLKTKTHSILKIEIDADEVKRLSDMPSIISSFNDTNVKSLYMLPPVKYPDGKTYVKLGAGGDEDELAPAVQHFVDASEDDHDLVPWFQSDGHQDIAEILKRAAHKMIHNLRAISYETVPCLLTYSEHGNPYIDKLADSIYVATAGNGGAAKSSDEIGRLGAILCATDTWDSELNREDFRAVYL